MVFSLTLSLVSCGGNGDENGDDTGEVGGNEGENGGNTGDGGDNGDGGADPEPDPEPLPPYTVFERYLPTEVSSALYANYLEASSGNGYLALSKTAGPYAYTDIETLTDCTLKSITIPVRKTSKADENGMHRFTIYKIDSSAEGLVSAPLETYTILIDAVKNELPIVATNTVYKVITVDLTEYNITIGKGETIAFVSSTDSISPAYLDTDPDNNYPMSTVIKTRFPQANSVFTAIGKQAKLFSYSTISLCFDLVLERTYENVKVYNEMLAEETQYKALVATLKQLYAGKNISIVGDSISTYTGYSNDASANSTTGSHNLYYPSKDYSFAGYQYTYWGRTLNDLGMKLCVNNSWSGARTYGGYKTAVDYNDRLPYRATELDRDDGTNPDVIFVYLGINDVLQNNETVPMGDLYAILADTTDTRSDDAKVAAWFQGVLVNAGSAPYKPKTGTATKGYTTFEQAYALGIYSMIQKYPAAEIYCLTLLFNYHSGFTAERFEMANRSIKAIAHYFGATIVDQSGEYSLVNEDNVHAYASTYTSSDCVHLSARGHELMERNIIMTMAKKNGLI